MTIFKKKGPVRFEKVRIWQVLFVVYMEKTASFIANRTENGGQKDRPVVKYVEKLNFVRETLVF